MRSDIFHVNPDMLPDGISYPSLFNELDAIGGGVSEITPELVMKLGFSAACCATRIAVGYSECSICKLLANAFISGAGSCGAQVTEIDAGFFAVASYIARSYLFNLTVFIENDGGKLRIRMIDKFGLPIERTFQRQIEYIASRRNIPRAGMADIVMPKSITETRDAFALSAAKRGTLEGFSVAVDGKSLSAEVLKHALSLSGCNISQQSSGILTLSVSSDGSRLRIRDEEARWHDDGHVDALLALIYFLSGERELAVSATAPSVVEQLASEFDGRIVRIGRDHGARETFLTQGVLTDAVSSAVFLCSYLFKSGKTVCELSRRLPAFTLISREITVNSDRRKILSRLADSGDGLHKEDTGELRVCADGGWVNISPARSKNSLRITGEGMSEEIASELCNLFIERTRLIDTDQQK